jgi:crotonobetainyl-CoA:carnitine CoA-transferase CaiB-like acyl-CoA transferase
VKLSDATGREDTPPPLLGQQTDAILMRDLGLTEHEVANLRQRGIV